MRHQVMSAILSAAPRRRLSCARKHAFQLTDPAVRTRAASAPRARTVQHKPDGCGIFGLGDFIAHSGNAARNGHAHRKIENIFGQFAEAGEMRAATGENQAGGNRGFDAAAAELVADQHQEFMGARLDDIGEHAGENGARRTVADAGDFDGGIIFQQRTDRRRRAGV